jgi:hypothetical protein
MKANRNRTVYILKPKRKPYEHCSEIALNDNRWVKANKTTKDELNEFNKMLERIGVYNKNPADYKSHFGRWKSKGKIQDINSTKNEKVNASAPPLKVI